MVGSYTYSWYPTSWTSQLEFVVGIMLGTWLPFMNRARNSDCFTNFWSLSLNIFRWHPLFDFADGRTFANFFDWVTFLSIPTLTIIRFYNTSKACAK